jgi:precorrin-6B methylase 1
MNLYPIDCKDWTKKDLQTLKAMLKGKDHRLTILFKGKPLLVGYGRYVVEYLETRNLPE